MYKGRKVLVNIVGFFIMITFFGCVYVHEDKLKTGSYAINSYEKWGLIQASKGISIRMLRPISSPTTLSKYAADKFPQILMRKIAEDGFYDYTEVLLPGDVPTTSLLVEAAVVNADPGISLFELQKKIKWMDATPRPQGKFSIVGRVVDINDDKCLLTFQASRLRDRDVYVVRYAVIHDQDLIKILMKWVADDIVAILKKAR